MASSSHKKLSISEKSDLLKFLQSKKVSVVGSYTLGQTLGEGIQEITAGSFGKVKLAYHNLTGLKVAVKIVDKIHAPQLVREIETWRQLIHPNIAQLYEVLTTESRIYMVSEYCHGGELLEFITKNGRMNDTDIQTKRIFRQIVEAVAHCHEKSFVHRHYKSSFRDLKLENILLAEDFNIKLIDFGFTRLCDNDKLMDTYCGSSAYAAPEIIAGQQYSGPESDVWSLGVVLYTIVCGYLPFDHESEEGTHHQIRNIDYELPDYLQPTTSDLIESIFKKIPSERLTVKQILNHSWLENVAIPKEATPSVTTSRLGVSTKEMKLAAQLEDIGLDVPSMLDSVHSNACDQLASTWHLLLMKKQESSPKSSSTDDKRVLDRFEELDALFNKAQQVAPFSATNPLLHLAGLNDSVEQLNSDPSLFKRKESIKKNEQIEAAFTNSMQHSTRPKSAATPKGRVRKNTDREVVPSNRGQQAFVSSNPKKTIMEESEEAF